MSKRHYCDNTHLTLSERIIIETGITNGSTKVAIAKTIGKDPSTVAKEIRRHRIYKPRRTYGHKSICVHRKQCSGCRKRVQCCSDYKEEACQERDRSPGACNGCKKKCFLPRYFYYAKTADEVYRETLVNSRVGINLTEERRKELAEVIAPLAKKGQSFYQILHNHPEIDLSDKTLYTYVALGVFKDYGLDSFTLKERVQRKQYTYKERNNTEKPLKPEDIYKKRTYNDFQKFKVANPNVCVVQMDTLYNSPEGPYVQTFFFENSSFMLGLFIRKRLLILWLAL